MSFSNFGFALGLTGLLGLFSITNQVYGRYLMPPQSQTAMGDDGSFVSVAVAEHESSFAFDSEFGRKSFSDGRIHVGSENENIYFEGYKYSRDGGYRHVKSRFEENPTTKEIELRTWGHECDANGVCHHLEEARLDERQISELASNREIANLPPPKLPTMDIPLADWQSYESEAAQ